MSRLRGITLLLAASLGLPACSSDEGEVDRQYLDNLVAYGVLDTTWFLFNQNLAGKPTGTQDLVLACPLGGMVHITGQTSVDDSTAINSVDLTYTMIGCANAGTDYDLVLNGEIHSTGTFRSTGYKALTEQSSNLHWSGSVGEGDEPVDETCAYSVNEQSGDFETGHVTGELCGRSIEF
ncbi:hypothetical protein ACNOYE_01120 [Nannocystaceae bacterium ST9]